MATVIPPDFWDLLGALIVSTISGIVSISRRVINGQQASLLWVVSEFFSAILCGYLMYSAYPFIVDDVPKWFTLPVAIAISAHIGGRVFQEVETNFCKYIPIFDRRKPQ